MASPRHAIRNWRKTERWYLIASTLWTVCLWLANFWRRRVIQKILVVKHDAIGDMVYALPAIHQLRAAHPHATITVWCNPAPAGLLQHDSVVNHVVLAPQTPIGSFDLEIELRGNWRTLWRSLRRPPRLRHDRGTVRLQNKLRGVYPHDLEINLSVVAPFVPAGFPRPTLRVQYSLADMHHVQTFLYHWQMGRYAVLHPGGSTQLRRWPLQNFAAVAAHLQAKGLHLVLCGGQEEKHLIEDLRQLLPAHVWHACALFSLPELAALCARAAIFVGNESGPLHVAAAAGCPVLGLFGPGEPHVFYPRGTSTEVRAEVLHVVLPCNPCDQIHCVHPDNPCIRRISVQQAIEKVDALLGNAALAAHQ